MRPRNLRMMLSTGAPATAVTTLVCVGVLLFRNSGALAAAAANMRNSNRRHSLLFVGGSIPLCPTRRHHRHPGAPAASSEPLLPRAARRTAANIANDYRGRSRGIQRNNSGLVNCHMTTTEEVSVLQLPRLDASHVAVLWFTACDLRTHDHDGLIAAASAAGVVPLYVFDNQVRYNRLGVLIQLPLFSAFAGGFI